MIPDAPDGRHARCGDASGIVCEMPDAKAPFTRGECPVDQGCRTVH